MPHVGGREVPDQVEAAAEEDGKSAGALGEDPDRVVLVSKKAEQGNDHGRDMHGSASEGTVWPIIN